MKPCDYLSDPENSTRCGPSATSTLWVFMIDPNLDDTERQIRQALLRDQLEQFLRTHFGLSFNQFGLG
ncbi:MAG: hypothetical protein Ct9H90mP16_17990 [Candidatus Poseidoniales archaeon]|nr:MAG: hypothetical protein Ct9H90mP16_17990 [Candidatus Poseidoniales archaeon]